MTKDYEEGSIDDPQTLAYDLANSPFNGVVEHYLGDKDVSDVIDHWVRNNPGKLEGEFVRNEDAHVYHMQIGDSIARTLDKLLVMCNATGVSVLLPANGECVEVKPNANGRALLDVFASPMPIEATVLHAKPLNSDPEMLDAIHELHKCVGWVDVLRTVKKLQPLTDRNVGVYRWHRMTIIQALNKRGYHANMHVNDHFGDESEFWCKRARYVVGQALACLQQGMGIHPQVGVMIDKLLSDVEP